MQLSLRFTNDAAPGSIISIIRETDSGRVIDDAVWWLLLDSDLKPNYKYASFNTRSDKLNQPRSAGYKAYRESRCIIPASAIVEGLGDKTTYHKIELVDQAMALGGLYKEWMNKTTGEIAYSASIITLGEHPKWQSIHPKRTPLILQSDMFDQWLDPAFKGVSSFDLLPRIDVDQRVTRIGKPSKWDVIEEPFIIKKD